VRLVPLFRRHFKTVGVVCACLAGGGCSSSSIDSNPFAQASSIFKHDTTTFVGRKSSQVVTAEDLITADGTCSGGPAPALTPEYQPDPAVQPDGTVGQASRSAALPENNDALLRPALGIALGMTECEVARRAGMPERVEVGADDRGERAVVLSYMRGERAGIYRFREGRLFTIERVAVVEEPKKPVKPKPKAPAKPAVRQAAKPAAASQSPAWPDAQKPQQPQQPQRQPAQAAPWPAPQQQQQAPAQSQVWPSAPPLRSGQPSG
jgi:hypothetical protein